MTKNLGLGWRVGGGYRAQCTACDWARSEQFRRNAHRTGRGHADETGHTVELRRQQYKLIHPDGPEVSAAGGSGNGLEEPAPSASGQAGSTTPAAAVVVAREGSGTGTKPFSMPVTCMAVGDGSNGDNTLDLMLRVSEEHTQYWETLAGSLLEHIHGNEHSVDMPVCEKCRALVETLS